MGRHTDDEQVVREMLTLDLEQAADALGYWIRRRERLPFYRRSARREAELMIAAWQARTIAAVPRQPVAALVSGRTLIHVAGLTAGYHARRIAARATRIALTGVAVFTVLAVLAVR
ncbi:MAG: hypothetical protein ACTHNU_04525 [Gaiellales bacterium]